jgi:DNA-binding NarL/FixJ family response regulator
MPGAKVLVLSSYNDEQCVEQLLEAGAAGYLIKQTAASDLSRAVQDVRRGNKFLSPTLARRLREPSRPFGFGSDVHESERLTPREEEVLKLVAGGRSNRESALELGISIKTIEKHRQQVMNKLHIHETAGLTRYALSRGLISAKEENQELMKHA